MLKYKKALKNVINIKNKSKNVVQDVVDFLYNNFGYYNWVGIYVVSGNDLVLSSWNGQYATEHTRIPIGKGICGNAVKTGKTEVVDDVCSDKRYLSCFVSTKSEIVVPVLKDEKIVGEIDIDSNEKGAFTIRDKIFLEKIADMLSEHI